jgi:hypothetical protein
MNRMHDWTLRSILYEWEQARVTFSLQWREEDTMALVAEGVSDLHIPHLKQWGPSVSINEVRESCDGSIGSRALEIEMQTGDVIKIEAADFAFPRSRA